MSPQSYTMDLEKKETKTMNMEFGNRLASYRKKAGLSQEELADKLGVTRQAVSKWECGESSPDTDNLIALAKLYNVTLDELIYGEKAKDKKDEDSFIHIKGEDGEVKINNVDIHLQDDEGNEVHIGKDGVKLKEGKDDDDDDDDVIINRGFRLFEVIVNAVNPLAIVIAYLLCGFLIPNGEGWRNYWILFFLIPIIPSLIVAIRKRRFCAFAFPVLIVMIYLGLGMVSNLWHPTWVMFLFIPVYYSIFGPIDAAIHRKNRKFIKIKRDVIDNED